MQYSSIIVDFVKFSEWYILFVLKRFQIFQIIATQFQLPKLCLYVSIGKRFLFNNLLLENI